MLGSPSSHNNDVDEFEVDIEALGLGAAITPAMLRFLTGSDAAPAVPASALPQSSSSVSGGSKLQPPPPSTLESSLADGSFEASLEPFQWLVRDVDPHDSSSIPTENDSLLRNLSDFDSRDSSGSSGRVMASTVAPRRAERTRDQPIRQISASSSKPSASAKARTAGEQPAMSLPSTVSMIQAIYKDKLVFDAKGSTRKRRQPLKEFLHHWFLKQFGAGGAGADARARLQAAVRTYRSSSPYTHNFGRLWGLFDALDDASSNFYLNILDSIVDARSSGGATVQPTNDGAAFLVLLSFLEDVVKIHFTDRVPEDAVESLLKHLKELGTAFGSRGLLYVDQEAFLSLCLQFRQSVVSSKARGSGSGGTHSRSTGATAKSSNGKVGGLGFGAYASLPKEAPTHDGDGGSGGVGGWEFDSLTPSERFKASLDRFNAWQEKREEAIAAAAKATEDALESECTFQPNAKGKSRGPAQAGLPSVVARCEEYIRGKEARMWAKLEEAQAAAMEECTFAPKITPYQWKTSGKVFDRLTRPAPKAEPPARAVPTFLAPTHPAKPSKPVRAPNSKSTKESSPDLSRSSKSGQTAEIALANHARKQAQIESFLLRQQKAREKAADMSRSPFPTGAGYTGTSTVGKTFSFLTDSRVGPTRSDVLAARRRVALSAAVGVAKGGLKGEEEVEGDVLAHNAPIGGAWARYAPLVAAVLKVEGSSQSEEEVDFTERSGEQSEEEMLDGITEQLHWLAKASDELPSLIGSDEGDYSDDSSDVYRYGDVSASNQMGTGTSVTSTRSYVSDGYSAPSSVGGWVTSAPLFDLADTAVAPVASATGKSSTAFWPMAPGAPIAPPPPPSHDRVVDSELAQLQASIDALRRDLKVDKRGKGVN